MKNIMKKISVLFVLAMLAVTVCMAVPAAAVDSETASVVELNGDTETPVQESEDSTGAKASAAALAIGLAAAAGAIGMGLAIAKSVEGISRQPEAEGKIRTSLMLGLVFVETAIIYALIVAILIIFVL